MRNTLAVLGTLGLLALFGAGCAGPEQKFGRGLGNMTEIVRGGEFDRAVEQSEIFGGTDVGLGMGIVRGTDKVLARTGVGIYEVITAPLPPYEPVWTSYLSPRPLYPDGFRPRKWSQSMTDTDHYLGFSGGDVFPLLPGSRFRIFDN